MRKLMFFTVGFAAACAVGAYFLLGNWLLLIGGICLVAGISLCFCTRKILRILAVILIGCAIGSVWNWGYQHFYLRDALLLDGKETEITITVTDYSYQTDYGTAVDGRLNYANKSYRVKLYLHDCLALEPGDRVQTKCTFRYTAQGAKTDPTFHQGKGIFLVGYGQDDYTVIESDTQQFKYFAVRLRRDILQRIEELFPDDVQAIAKALLLGDGTDMTYEENTIFSISGIRHVVAVSGLHVSILFSVISILCLRRRYLITIIGLPVLFIFAAVTGFTPSVMRACLMQALVILSMATMQESDSPTSLAFSVLVILGINPQSITDIGFQLSVACMIGIFGFESRIRVYIYSRKWIKAMSSKKLGGRILKPAITSISMSLSIWTITTPLCVIHFGKVSIIGIVTNLLTIWLMNFIFCGIIVACVLSLISLPAGCCVAWLLSWLIRLVRAVSGTLSGLPFAAVYTESEYTVLWLILSYLLIAAFVLLRYKRPGLLLSCMLAGLVFTSGASAYAERQVESRITVLDVGNGQCVVLKHQDEYYLVDCGGRYDFDAADIAAEYLLSRGINKVDGVILSHYDREHAGGLLPLMTRIEVEQLYLPDIEPDNALRQAIIKSCSDKITWVSNQEIIEEANITMFGGGSATSGNEGGICVLFQPNNCDILILGDRRRPGELALLEQADIPELELLVVGHHGADGAASFEFLLETRPQAAVISVGESRYHYPSLDTIERLEDFDCQVLRTDEQGTIEFGR